MFNPLLKTKKSLYVDIALRADSGQWHVTSAKIPLSTERAWNKEGVAWSQKWLPYHLPEGYSGVTGVRRQRQNESNRTLGNSPRRWRRAYINITHATLSISRSLLSLRDLFDSQIKTVIARFSSFFSRCTILFVPRAPFSKQISTWLNITKFFLQFYIEIWQFLDSYQMLGTLHHILEMGNIILVMASRSDRWNDTLIYWTNPLSKECLDLPLGTTMNFSKTCICLFVRGEQ